MMKVIIIFLFLLTYDITELLIIRNNVLPWPLYRERLSRRIKMLTGAELDNHLHNNMHFKISIFGKSSVLPFYDENIPLFIVL